MPLTLPDRPQRPRRKYGNTKTRLDGLVFDSKAEAQRWAELQILQRIGRIKDLERQVNYLLIPQLKLPSGKWQNPCIYVADFRYRRADDTLVVEDVKSEATLTDAYIIKRKLMFQVFGIEILETQMRKARR